MMRIIIRIWDRYWDLSRSLISIDSICNIQFQMLDFIYLFIYHSSASRFRFLLWSFLSIRSQNLSLSTNMSSKHFSIPCSRRHWVKHGRHIKKFFKKSTKSSKHSIMQSSSLILKNLFKKLKTSLFCAATEIENFTMTRLSTSDLMLNSNEFNALSKRL